jgi:hypothetical protein
MNFKKDIWPSGDGYGNFSIDFVHTFNSQFSDGILINFKKGCAEGKTGFTFLFSDSSRVNSSSFGKFSCDGKVHLLIGNSILDNSDLKNKLLNFELRGVAFSTVSQSFSRKLTADESVLLKNSFQCFWQISEADRAKEK